MSPGIERKMCKSSIFDGRINLNKWCTIERLQIRQNLYHLYLSILFCGSQTMGAFDLGDEHRGGAEHATGQ